MSAETEQIPSGTTAPPPEGKYVYCIIESQQPRSFGPIGIGGRGDEVYTVHHEGMAAVVSNTPIQVYDPTRENVFAHEQVNEAVMREFTVLPMAFGALFRTEDDIIELMRGTYEALRDVLAKMEGKVEFGLKVNWDRERVIAEIEGESEEIGNLKEQITSRANKPIGDKMIMNAAFLIERDREQEFDNKVKDIAAKYEGKLSFKYTGPWPPYNFVHIRLKLERGESTTEAIAR